MKQIPKFSEFLSKVNESKPALTKEEIIEKFKLTLNSDGSYDAPGSVYLSEMGLIELPLKFGKVEGSFDCSNNKLTSLEGCPTEVGNNFSCNSNELTSLEHGPSVVNNNCWCNNNKLTTIGDDLKVVGGWLYLQNNKFTEIPKNIKYEMMIIKQGNKIPDSEFVGINKVE